MSRGSFQQLLYLTGERAIPERFLLKKLLRPGMRVVDVGANIGYYAAMCLDLLGPEGHVTCIEPSPDNLKELDVNIRENRWSNVVVHGCAVGNNTTVVGLKDGVNSGIVNIGGAFTVLDHVLDPREAACEMRKALKDNGKDPA